MADTPRHTVNECQCQIPCPVLFLCVSQAPCGWPDLPLLTPTSPVCWTTVLTSPWFLQDTQPWHSSPRNAPEGNYLLSITILITAVKTTATSSLTTVLNDIINNNNCLREMVRHRNVCSRNVVSAASDVVSRCREILAKGQTGGILKTGSSARGRPCVVLYCTVLYCMTFQIVLLFAADPSLWTLNEIWRLKGALNVCLTYFKLKVLNKKTQYFYNESQRDAQFS